MAPGKIPKKSPSPQSVKSLAGLKVFDTGANPGLPQGGSTRVRAGGAGAEMHSRLWPQCVPRETGAGCPATSLPPLLQAPGAGS